jgi:hypothetical protein
MKLTPEQAFFNSAPIDPKAPHLYFLNRGIDTTRFSDLDRVVRVEPRYRREQTLAPGPALIAAVTDNEGRIVGRQYKPLTADLSAKDGIEPKTKNGAGDKVKGYAIRLGPAWETLYLAEGLECDDGRAGLRHERHRLRYGQCRHDGRLHPTEGDPRDCHPRRSR